MHSLEKMIMEEISSLPELHLIDVLGFIRYLKMERRGAPVEIEAWFESAIKTIRENAQELHITEEAIKNRSSHKKRK